MVRIFILCLLLPFTTVAQHPKDAFETAKEILQAHKSQPATTDSALLQLRKAIQLLQESKTDSAQILLARLLLAKSRIEYSRSNYQPAIEDALSALTLVESTDSVKLCYQLYHNLSACYTKIGSDLSNLGTAQERKNYLTQSERYSRKALTLATTMQDTFRITQSLGALANFYLGSQAYDSAEYYSQRVLQQSSPQDYKLRANAYNYLGIIAYGKNDFNSAERYFNLAIVESKQDSSGSLVLLSAMGNLANVYMEQERYALAKQKLFELLELNILAKRKQNISKNYITLSNIYRRQKKYDSALFAYENYYLYKDSILDENHKAAIQTLEARYESEKKEKEIQTLSLNNIVNEAALREKNLWITLISSGMLFVILFFFGFIRHRSLKHSEQTAEIKSQLISAQMNPHFLFNALNSIQRLYTDGKIEEGNIFMSNFAQFVRDILDKTGRIKIPLYEEVAFLEAYLSLEKKRLGNMFDYRITISEELKNSMVSVPSLISQPLVENALIHGILPKGESGFIDIEIKRKQHNQIMFTIKDNGIGYEQAQARKAKGTHTSKGLGLIHARLGKKGKLIIKDLFDHSGTEATLQLSAEL